MLSRELEAELEYMLRGAEYTIVGPRDTRRRVTPTTVEPYKHICQISAQLPSPDHGGAWVTWIGSGTLIAPNKVLTAAHVVYSLRYRVYARSVRVAPGKDGSGAGVPSEPFGATGASRLDVPAAYRATTSVPTVVAANDYAVITLASRIGDRRRRGAPAGSPPLGFWRRWRAAPDSVLRSARVNTSGYPADKGGDRQYRSYNRVAGLTADRILYENDTEGGQSGGPVWLRWQQHRVLVGIHTNGFNPSAPLAARVNSGVRLNATNLAAIQAWVRT